MRIHQRFLLPTMGSFLAGLGILFYTAVSGPGWQFFRFYMGDVVAVAFLYFVLSLFWSGPDVSAGGNNWGDRHPDRTSTTLWTDPKTW